MQLNLAPKRSASCCAAARQFLRSHVVGRRVDEIAGERRGLRHSRDVGDVDAVGRHQLDVGRVRLAVAAEAVTAERKGERGEPRVVRRIGEAIDARRQQAGQRAGPEQVAGFAARVLEAEHDLRDLPSAAGSVRQAPGFAAKPFACANCRARGKVGGDRLPCRLGRERDRNGRCGGRGLEH